MESINELDIFKNVSKETINAFIEYSEIKEYKSGETLFYDKEKVMNIYIVMSGNVSLYKINENGQKKVVFILNRGNLINEVIIQDLTSSINCDIFEDAKILCIERNKLISIMEKDFELCKNIINSLSIKTRRMYRQLKNTPSSIKLEKKLAAKLYKLGKDYGIEYENKIMINMDITITYIADLLGSQRESVSRAIKVLQKNNLIEFNCKRLYIYDLQSLANFFKAS